MALSEYRDIIGLAAGVTTVGQFFSPCFMCFDIIKRKSCKDVDYTPFIGGMGISILMFQHGLILKDPAMIPVNIFGFVLNLIYLGIYYYYADNRAKLFGACAKMGAVVSVLIAYANYEDKNRVEFTFGMIVTILLLALIGAPLFSIKEIMRKKSTAELPLPLILSGTVVSTLWFLYGIAINNMFMIFQNLVALSLLTIQLSLFVIYPRTSVPHEEKKKK